VLSYQSVRELLAKEKDKKASTKKKKLSAEMKTTYKVEKCRARKNLRYQYLDKMIAEREKANDLQREETMKQKTM
jgi:hypothetical protein